MKSRRRPTVWSRVNQGDGGSAGYDLAACVLVGWGLGWASQRFCGVPEPWGLLGGLLLGSVSGFYQLFKAQSAPGRPKAAPGDAKDGDGRA